MSNQKLSYDDIMIIIDTLSCKHENQEGSQQKVTRRYGIETALEQWIIITKVSYALQTTKIVLIWS